ncbi:hypothetical protein CHARACLAT_017373 [Characodon lateralis]|uniref:Uncharacterized protein n=1 Tax=Characodon lateralis TaxID=208331 RepID=A0ABU7EK48_9TELE|nr:hypothetical protein [Characodon lateralis]
MWFCIQFYISISHKTILPLIAFEHAELTTSKNNCIPLSRNGCNFYRLGLPSLTTRGHSGFNTKWKFHRKLEETADLHRLNPSITNTQPDVVPLMDANSDRSTSNALK